MPALRRGGSIVDRLGVTHHIASYVENMDGEPMFIGTTCAPGSTVIWRCGKASQDAPTCFACALGREDQQYVANLFATIENVAFIRKREGGIQMVKDKIALDKLTERLKNPPKQIDNGALYAGSAMHFYCKLCGWKSDTLPESYSGRPKSHCTECMELKKANPEITDGTLKELATRLTK